MMKSDFEQQCAETRWFHAIDFGDFSSSGRFPPGTPQNITLFGFMDLIQHVDLKNADVLDIGAADGLASFGMHGMGAKSVTAIDTYELPTFRLAQEILDIKEIDYRPGVQIKDACSELGEQRFDVILCAGVIYHMLNPLDAFIAARKLLKQDGLVVFETPVDASRKDAALVLNSEEMPVPEAYTYWVPTVKAVTGMLKLLGFDVLAIRNLKAPSRVTVLARKVSPDQVRNRTSLLERLHEVDFCDFEFQFKTEAQGEKSEVVYTGPEDEKIIDPAQFATSFPYHSHNAIGLGKTKWSTETGNR